MGHGDQKRKKAPIPSCGGMGHRAWSIEFKNKKTPIPSRGSHSAERIAIKNLENKKLRSPPYEEMELSQRTGQLLIVCLLGRGTPVVVTLPLYGLSVKDGEAWGYAVGGWRSASLEVGGRGKMIADLGLEGHRAWGMEHGVKDKKKGRIFRGAQSTWRYQS